MTASTAAEAVRDARGADRPLVWILAAVAAVCGALAAGGLIAVVVVVNGVAGRAEKVARAAAYQQWTDCVEDLSDRQEALFEEHIGDLFGAALVHDDDVEALAIAAELDALDLTPSPAEILAACGPQPPKEEM